MCLKSISQARVNDDANNENSDIGSYIEYDM
jgi:hypothetical protein